MAYQFRYRLQSQPTPRNDGSGCVDHDIFAEASSDGENWITVPGRHKTISVPAVTLQAALGAGTFPQIAAAYKNALAANLAYQPIPVAGWTIAQLAVLMEANDAAIAAAEGVDGLGLTYPVRFVI